MQARPLDMEGMTLCCPMASLKYGEAKLRLLDRGPQWLVSQVLGGTSQEAWPADICVFKARRVEGFRLRPSCKMAGL